MAEVETDGLDEGASSRSMSASSTPRPTMLTQPLMDSDDNDSQASAELAPLGSCAELCEWSSDEAHHMLFACCMPSRDPDAPSVQACSRRWSEYRLCVALNPVYWVGWLCLLPVLLLGKCVHAAFGQHGPISESDTPLEREVRVWWVYPVSGWFSLGLAAVAANAAAYGAEGTLTQFEHWSVLLIAATMYLLCTPAAPLTPPAPTAPRPQPAPPNAPSRSDADPAPRALACRRLSAQTSPRASCFSRR